MLALALVLVGAGSLAGGALAQGTAATSPSKGALYRDGQTNRYLLGGIWLSRPDPAGVGIAQGWWRSTPSTAGWSELTVPNSFNAGDLSDASMFGSVAWYRRDFTLPARAFSAYVPRSLRSWVLRFESVNYRATVWLNGKLIGTHAGAFLPFEYSVGHLRAGVNRLVVRVDDRRTGSDFPPGPNGGWWNFGGILREVYLRPVQRADIAQAQIRPVLSCLTCAAQVEDQITVRNPNASPQTVRLSGTYGPAKLTFGAHTIPGHGTWTANAVGLLRHPHLWSIDAPFLYHATLRLADSRGRTLAGYSDFSGVRSIKVVRGHLELNGRALHLRGFNLHEQAAGSGAALSPTQLSALVGWVRAAGGHLIRAHYPLNPQIEEMADRDGILLWSEVPVYQVAPGLLGAPGWLARAHALLRANILTNQNHPSVLLWSIANELRTPPDRAQARYVSSSVALAHKLDPTRPAGMAISSWPGVPCESAYAALDVIGYNDYFGWFDAGGGTTDDREALGPYLDFLHACYPRKALMITEFGFEASRSGPVEERGTYAFRDDAVDFHLGVMASKPYLSGASYHTIQDFAAKPGWSGGDPFPHPPYVEKGYVDINGNIKPGFQNIKRIYDSTSQIAPRRRPASRRR